MVATGLVLLAAMAGWCVGVLVHQVSPAAAGASIPATPTTATVRVEPGQTLWQIARDAAPRADVRATVDRIHELNRLDGDPLMPGQVLVVPVSR